MANLSQLSLFSNFVTVPPQWCDFWVGVVRTAVFYWFQGRNLLGDNQNFKRGGHVKKGKDQISRGYRTIRPPFVKTNFEYIFQSKFYQRLVKLLRNLGYNDNLI